VRSALVGLFLLLPTATVFAGDGQDGDESSLFDRLNVREQVLDGQRDAALSVTRERALFAYRLLRQRELGFAANPETRLEHARTFDLALVALRRSFEETRSLSLELDKVRVDRSALEAALIARALEAQSAGQEAGASHAARPAPLQRPVRGTPVAFPGVRRDGPTKVSLQHDSVQFLARLNDPVHAVARGEIKRVEALPQGGFAVVIAHSDGLTSITTGLRDITVQAGAKVTAGQVVGFVGRNLDGAAVLSVELWRERRVQDSGKLLRARLRTPG
jgi:murein DD-endopeptidase MepM/ murein hydrolase activator NlpD